MTKEEVIRAILQDYPDVEQAMAECFCEGFLRGEDFGGKYYNNITTGNKLNVQISSLARLNDPSFKSSLNYLCVCFEFEAKEDYSKHRNTLYSSADVHRLLSAILKLNQF